MSSMSWLSRHVFHPLWDIKDGSSRLRDFGATTPILAAAAALAAAGAAWLAWQLRVSRELAAPDGARATS